MSIRKPLVSIIIPNYNHSQYLDQSIQSALNQTYTNIEIIVNDNCSTDDSIEVLKKYISQGVIINKNPVNISNNNYRVVYERSRGKYFILLCADDFLVDDFVERAVEVMEQDESICLFHGERHYIDEKGNVTELDPFFCCDFKVSGEKMLPIFMLTDVGQSAQALIRRSVFERVGCHDTEHDHTNIDREQWFRLCMEGNYAYSRKQAAYIRVPAVQSQTSIVINTFYHPIALYVTLKGYVHWGILRGYDEVVLREETATKKLVSECLGMVEMLIKERKYSLARKYILFLRIVDEDVYDDERYQRLCSLLENKDNMNTREMIYGKTENFTAHKRSYEPPAGYISMGEF